MCFICALKGKNLHKPISNGDKSLYRSLTETIDAANSTATSYSLSTGDSFSGSISTRGDKDWVSISLEAGDEYQFDLKGRYSGVGTLNDTYLRLYNSAGTLVAYDDDSGASYESRLNYQAVSSGTYYLSAGAYSYFDTGTYLLTTSLIRSYGEFQPNNDISSTYWNGINKDNDYVKGLQWGAKWGNNPNPNVNNTNLKYYIYDNESTLGNHNALSVKPEEKQAYLDAIDAFSSVANLSFTKVDSDTNGNILFAGLNNNESYGALGWAIPPDTSNFSNFNIGLTTQNQDYYVSNGKVVDENILKPGSYYYITTIHELGHSIGLKHPHNIVNNNPLFPGVSNNVYSDLGDNGLNAQPYTVMTYNDIAANDYMPSYASYSGFLETLGAFDIAAVQYLYGANSSYSTDNNTYFLDSNNLRGWRCIWDNGGTDTINALSSSELVSIDLRNASLENAIGGGGYVSQVGANSLGYTIAFNSTGNCQIENATGSNFADSIQGNYINNILKGEAGNDLISGNQGDDILIGGDGSDQLIGGLGSDTASYSTSSSAVSINLLSSTFSGGDAEGDTLTSIENITGSDYADILIGDSQNNILTGGVGGDQLNGGGGSDAASYSTSSSAVSINLLSSAYSGGDADGDSLTSIENIIGSDYADLIIGDSQNNSLNGGSGNDTLYGGEGSNTYTGGSGDDFAVFNFARSSTTSISSTSVTTSTQTETLSGIEGKAFLEVNHGGSFVAGQAGFQDIDGDGKTDLILQNNSLQFWTTSGSSSGLVSTSLSFEHGGTPGFTRDQMQFADINGDGYSDAIWQGNDNQFWSNFGSSSGFGGSSLVNTHGGAFDPDKVQYVDVTGDGAEDLIYHGDDNRFWLSKSNGTNFDNPIHAATHGGPTNFASVQYADVDGDGKKDMLYHGIDNRFWISKSNGTKFGGAYFANQHGGAFDTTKVQYADIDGDGKDDMFYQGDDNRIWVAKSNGTKFINNTLAASVTHDDFDTDQVSFFDMNGDDKADMVYQGEGNEVWYYESNGSTFDTAEQIADFSGSFIEGSLGLGDIDGDGSGDLFYQDSSNDFYIALNSDFM